LLISFLPTMVAFGASPNARRLQYLIAGLVGGVAGEACGTASLFLSLWFSC
jgi:hypothetical protein